MKDRAKTFLYISVGFLAISLAVQNFTLEATAQTDRAVAIMDHPSTTGSQLYVLMESGDIYLGSPAIGWSVWGNPLDGGVPASEQSTSSVKSMYGR